MITEIATGLTATKHLKDLLAGAKGLSDAAKVNAVIVEAQQYMLTVQQALFEAQQAVSEVTQEKAELERQITEMEDWCQQEKLYQPIHPKDGATVYALIEECEGGNKPPRMYCPNCFAKRQARLLQRHRVNSEQMKCFDCEFVVDIGDDFTPVAIF